MEILKVFSIGKTSIVKHLTRITHFYPFIWREQRDQRVLCSTSVRVHSAFNELCELDRIWCLPEKKRVDGCERPYLNGNAIRFRHAQIWRLYVWGLLCIIYIVDNILLGIIQMQMYFHNQLVWNIYIKFQLAFLELFYVHHLTNEILSFFIAW